MSASRLVAACLAAFLAACLPERQAGGGSETTIGIAGRVVDGDGNPLAGVAVRIRPEGALPPGLLGAAAEGDAEQEPPAAVTRADGSYAIADIAPGKYLVECRDEVSRAALVAAQVSDSVERLPDAVLRPTGAIRGRVGAPAGNEDVLNAVYVYIPGLAGRVVSQHRLDSLRFLLADIPAGRHRLRVQPAFPLELSRLGILEIPDVEVAPGDTLDLDSIVLPLRSGIRDSAYTRDSLAVAAVLRANEMPEDMVSLSSATSGSRITMLYALGSFTISRIPAEVGLLDGLEVLYLMAPAHDAPWTPLDVAPEIASLRGLKRLWLDGYALAGLPAWARSFPELASLKLAGAGLDAFPAGAEDFPFLVSLDLSGNAIPDLPASIARLKRLRVLDVSGNELAELPRELLAMPGLRGFRARHNRLCSLDAEMKAWLTRQDSLWIRQADPLSYYFPPVDSGWEASQRCD